jgi:hypothetical protein
MHLIFSQGAFYVKALPAGPALKCDHAKPQIYSTHGIKEIALGVKKNTCGSGFISRKN